MDEILIQRFAQLISARIGLQIRPQDYPLLSEKILARCRELRCSHPQDYYGILTGEDARSQTEWLQLVPMVTTPESYFFRDRGQFKLLETVILPELISRQEQKKQLQIWSAGCSTGEEPYSLSLLLQKMLPNWEEWKIIIVGTDINERALQKARQGVYSSWSFRQVDPEIISRSFQPWGGGWKINQTARKSVYFSQFNLANDDIKNDTKLGNFDLILCRNVFVYFDKHHIATTLQKFYQALKPEGYLITAHAELQGVENNPFKPILFPESVVYKRPPDSEVLSSVSSPNLQGAAGLCLVLSPGTKNNGFNSSLKIGYPANNAELKSQGSRAVTANLSAKSRIVSPKNNGEIREAHLLFNQKKYGEAIQKINGFLQANSPHFEAYYLLAKIYANLGEYPEATEYCQRAMAADSLSVLPCYLLLNIAEETEDIEEAKKLAKRIIYLSGDSPSSIFAYVKLASLYEREDNKIRAKKHYGIALELLQNLPPQTRVECTENITVADLKTSLNDLIEKFNC